jgi:eukaryotic-like serine/threonine-protein kinase
VLTASFMGEYNLGELLYQGGDPDAAWVHVRRAVELEMKRLSGLARPVARLLEARLLVYLGRDQDARRVFDDITAVLVEAERTGDQESVLLPSEQVLLRLVDLTTREATEAELADLESRARAASVEQEPIEIAELMALALSKHGQPDRARRKLDEALALAQKVPNVMEKRLRQTEERLQAAGIVSRAG